MRTWTWIVAAGLAMPAFAQAPAHALEAQASLVSVSPETLRIVDGRSLAGLALGLAYRGRLQDTGLQHRVHLDLLGLRTTEATGMEGAAPKHLEFGWDLLFPKGRWTLYAGFQGIRWKQSLDDQTSNDFRDYSLTGTRLMNSPQGTKLGARVGAEFALRPGFAAFAGYTQTELNKKHNPGWFSLGVTYRLLQR